MSMFAIPLHAKGERVSRLGVEFPHIPQVAS
jgi:hypothetical protein